MSSEVSDPAVKEMALTACKDYLGGPWEVISTSDFRLSQMTGGFSNTMYCCSLPENVEKDPEIPNKVLLRIYGRMQDDRYLLVSGAVIFTLLSERKLGPKLYGLLPKGRIEEYIPSHSLSRDELRLYAPSIAREMAKIHVLDVPLKKVPDLFQKYMTEWLNELEEAAYKADEETFLPVSEYRKEQEWFMKEIEKRKSPIVFCHNDLLGGNILFREDVPPNERPNLLFIDFEIACYNYRGFEFGAHFCEWCIDYHTSDYPNFQVNLEKFPTRQEQIDFFTVYLEQLSKEGVQLKRPLKEEIESMFSEISLFASAASLLWSLWFIKASHVLHYREHAKSRIKIYKKFKEEYLASQLEPNTKSF